MKVGVTVPQVGGLAGRECLVTAAQTAEDVGLSSLWISDHVAFPKVETTDYPYSRDGRFPVGYDAPFLECLVTLAFVAARTERLTIGTSVLVLPLRNTLLAAKQLGTVACLAPGRLVVGLGAGWLREEFALLEAEFERRGDVLHDQVRALRGLWSTAGYGQEGSYVAFPELLMEPRPPVVPEIWIGGTTGPALRRAGALGDAWHTIGRGEPEELSAKMERVRNAAAAAGRDPSVVGLTARIGARPGPDAADVLRGRLDMLASIGCSHVVVDPAIPDADSLVPFYEMLADVAKGVTTHA